MMRSTGKAFSVAMAYVLLSTGIATYAQGTGSSLTELRHKFATPPNEAKPMVRWWWFGPAVTRDEILRELQQMKADGMQGAELAFVYPETLDDPAKGLRNLPFLSPEMLDAVNYAQSQGRMLGLRIDVTLCSGWPYGGPATRLEEAAGRLKTVEIPVAAGVTSISVPKPADGDTLLYAVVANGVVKKWDAGSAKALDTTSWRVDASAEPRVAVLFYASHTRQQVKRAAVGAEGFVLDPFSSHAVATHLKEVGEPLVGAFGKTPPYAIFSDSLEAYGADWTPQLPQEFAKRRGYDLIPHLPELVAGGSEDAAKVRHDWGKTLTDLVNENYLAQINAWAHTHGTKFRSQTYGEPAVSLSSQRLVDLAEGEGPQWRAFSTLRWATSGNHIFDRTVTSGETFTWLHSPVFRATPLDMKAEADIDFIMGENQLMFHGWPYSAPQAGEPGWSLYAAAVFNDHNPWHPVMPSVTAYIARLSYLLRQGKPANQVAVLLPTDDAWAGFTPGKVTVTGAMQKLVSKEMVSSILSEGYNFDFIDADAIERLGIHHAVLVLPPTDRIPLAALAKLNEFAAHGGHIIALGHVPSMDAEGKPLQNAAQATKAIALVPDTVALGRALQNAVTPDLQFLEGTDRGAKDRIGFIRRRLQDGDIYFIANTSNQTLQAVLNLATAYREGVFLNADTGDQGAIIPDSHGIRVTLAPYESRVILFADMGTKSRNLPAAVSKGEDIDISGEWNVSFTGMQKTVNEHALTDWTSDPATLHYSGEAVYTRDVTYNKKASHVYLEISGGSALPGSPDSAPEHPVLGPDGLPNPLITRTGPGMHAYFDPPVREAALVTVNGKAAGALWHPPYRLEVTKMLQPGRNRIEIRVYNTALNAWSAQPPRDYKPLIEKYGDRFQMQDLDKVSPVPSGILGSIRLITKEAD